MPEPLPVENTPDLRTDFPPTSHIEFIEQEQRIAEMEAALKLSFAHLVEAQSQRGEFTEQERRIAEMEAALKLNLGRLEAQAQRKSGQKVTASSLQAQLDDLRRAQAQQMDDLRRAQAQQMDGLRKVQAQLDDLWREQAQLHDLEGAVARDDLRRAQALNDLRLLRKQPELDFRQLAIEIGLPTLLGTLSVTYLVGRSFVRVFGIIASRRDPLRFVEVKPEAVQSNSSAPESLQSSRLLGRTKSSG